MTKIQVRRDTAANWAAKNPVPAQGEPCYETDTRKLKFGDGSNTYVNLPYIEGGGSSGGGDVTQAGDNTFTGTNTFTGNMYAKDFWVSPTGKQWDALRIIKNDGGATFSLGTPGDISFEMTDADAGLVVGDNMRDIHNTNTAKYYLKQDSITAGDNVSIEETTKGIKISATGGGASVASDNGIRGDYESRYGIISSPNGILTDSQDEESNLVLTLHQGLVMQCAGQDAKTTISADTTHTVESTTEFDLFYAAGAFYEAAEVVFSETEPAGSDTGITAWFNPNKTANPDQKWQFKSNTNGNTWASAAAGRIAHIHTNGTAITRIDYAGCRILDGQQFSGVWVPKKLTLATTFTMPKNSTQTYDLSEYLPKDDYQYEVMISTKCRTGETSGSSAIMNVWSDLFDATTSGQVLVLCYTNTRASSFTYAGGSGVLPIGTDRKIYVNSTSGQDYTITSLEVRAYRRLGKN